MTGREKIEAAFSAEGSAEFGVVIPYEGIYIRDRWDDLTIHPWWWMFAPDVERQLEWRREAARSMGHDWLAVPGVKPAAMRENTSLEVINEDVYLVDKESGTRKPVTRPLVSGVGTSVAESRHLEALPESIDQIDSLIKPNTSDPADLGGADDLAKAIFSDFGRGLMPAAHVHTPLWECYGLWGFEGMMSMIAERPDLVRRACERILDKTVWQVKRHAAMGARLIWIEECLTDQISPAAYSSICLPTLRGVTDAIRAAGMKSIQYYCGDPAGKWDILMDSGADALSLEEAKKGFVNDIAEAAQIVRGRKVLLGNLDAVGVLQDGSEDDVRDAVRQQIAAGRANGGRFVMSLGSPVTPATPPARVRLYCELAREMSAA